MVTSAFWDQMGAFLSGHDQAPVLGERLCERPHPGDLVVHGNTSALG